MFYFNFLKIDWHLLLLKKEILIKRRHQTCKILHAINLWNQLIMLIILFGFNFQVNSKTDSITPFVPLNWPRSYFSEYGHCNGWNNEQFSRAIWALNVTFWFSNWFNWFNNTICTLKPTVILLLWIRSLQWLK